MKNFRPWLEEFTDDSVNAVATKINVSQGNLNRQIAGTANMPAETVVKIARAYGINPLPGLVFHGLVTNDELADASETYSLKVALLRCSDDQILREVKRRLDAYAAERIQLKEPE